MHSTASTMGHQQEQSQHSLAISPAEDDATTRTSCRPYLLSDETEQTDWVSKLELETALDLVDSDMARNEGARIKVLVLYGSMRERYVFPDEGHEQCFVCSPCQLRP